MFAAIYQAYVYPNYEQEYQQLWHLIASYFIDHCGALGSCLHKTEQGVWLAYSRWPNKETRDAVWPNNDAPADHLPDPIKRAIKQMLSYINQEHELPNLAMTVIDDLL